MYVVVRREQLKHSLLNRLMLTQCSHVLHGVYTSTCCVCMYVHNTMYVFNCVCIYICDLQYNVSADGSAQCYLKDPRTPSVQCGNYSTSQSDYVLTHLAPTISKPSLHVNTVSAV